MGTMAERILGAPAGETVVRDVDLVYSHDATTPLAMEAFRQLWTQRLARPERAAVVYDHAYPAVTVDQANLQGRVTKFVQEQGFGHFYRGEGICHQLLLEKGLAWPGAVVIGADSHTTTLGAAGAFACGVGATDCAVVWATGKTWLRVPDTIRVELQGKLHPRVTVKDLVLHLTTTLGSDGASYRALEYGGPGLRAIPFAERIPLANMAAEMEAKTGLLEVDDAALAWLEPRVGRALERIVPSRDAAYERVVDVDLGALEPQVARPPRVDDAVPVSALAGMEVDKVFIGTCTNGRYEDLALAASVLRGKRVKVPLLVAPASQAEMRRAMDEGILQDLMRAGATMSGTGCGPCLGRMGGVLGDEEVCVSTSSRNYQGRMGSPKARIYLAGPLVAAASALEGRIADPREVAPVAPVPEARA